MSGPEGVLPREVEDAEYLEQVSDRVQLNDHPMSARWVSAAEQSDVCYGQVAYVGKC